MTITRTLLGRTVAALAVTAIGASTSGVGARIARDAGYDTGAAWSSGLTPRTRRAGELVVGCAFDVYDAAAPATFAPGPAFAARATAGGVFLEDRRVARAGRYEAAGTRLPHPLGDHWIRCAVKQKQIQATYCESMHSTELHQTHRVRVCLIIHLASSQRL